jgi:uncharacterized protein YndB with AHSA1/START domain
MRSACCGKSARFPHRGTNTRMARIYTKASIRKPIEQIFDYVTTPGNWPKWHPSSLKVAGATDHSLELREKVTEDYLVAGRRGQVVWTVREREAPRHWVIQAGLEGGGGGTVSYTLTQDGGATLFEREFIYHTPGVIYDLLDILVMRRRIERESEQALRNLKRLLESS